MIPLNDLRDIVAGLYIVICYIYVLKASPKTIPHEHSGCPNSPSTKSILPLPASRSAIWKATCRVLRTSKSLSRTWLERCRARRVMMLKRSMSIYKLFGKQNVQHLNSAPFHILYSMVVYIYIYKSFNHAVMSLLNTTLCETKRWGWSISSLSWRKKCPEAMKSCPLSWPKSRWTIRVVKRSLTNCPSCLVTGLGGRMVDLYFHFYLGIQYCKYSFIHLFCQRFFHIKPQPW